MLAEDLGLMGYREAWEGQDRVHGEVVAGGEERVILVEHQPVITEQVIRFAAIIPLTTLLR